MSNNPPPGGLEADPPWDEKEMTELAAEILQQRARLNPNLNPLASRLLFDTIHNDQQFVTSQLMWDHLRLPRNRTLAACKGIFNGFRELPRQGSVSGYGPQGFAAPSPMINPAPFLPSNRKRPASTDTGSTFYPGPGQRLAPKPTFPVGPNRPQSGSLPPSPLDNPPASGGEHPARKKRGRPSKKDLEDRKQALERAPTAQMVLPTYASPLMHTQTPFPAFSSQAAHAGPREMPADTSAPQSPHSAGITATPRNTNQPEGDVNSSSSSSRKKRGRPPKVDTETTIPAPSFSASASSAGAYGSPPQSGVSVGTVSRRLSISTRSQGTTAGPAQQEHGIQQIMGEDSVQQQNNRQRSWNDTVMGSSSSNNNPNLRQQQQQP